MLRSELSLLPQTRLDLVPTQQMLGQPAQAFQWVTLSVMYAGPLDTLLSRGIFPYLGQLADSGVLGRHFYYQRLWDRGPQVRLHLPLDQHMAPALLFANAAEHLAVFFQKRPSRRAEPRYPDFLPPAYRWLPNDSVQAYGQRPDIAALGGQKLLHLAEEQFALSTARAMGCLGKQNGPAEQLRYCQMSALSMHVGLLRAFGLEGEALADFLEAYFLWWVAQGLPKDRGGKAFAQQRAQSLGQWLQQHAQGEGQMRVRRFVAQALAGIEQPHFVSLDNAHLMWYWRMENLYSAYRQAIGRGQLRPDQGHEMHSLAAGSPHYDAVMWPLLATFIQQSNHRLGIIHQAEGYLMHSLWRTVAEGP